MNRVQRQSRAAGAPGMWQLWAQATRPLRPCPGAGAGHGRGRAAGRAVTAMGEGPQWLWGLRGEEAPLAAFFFFNLHGVLPNRTPALRREVKEAVSALFLGIQDGFTVQVAGPENAWGLEASVSLSPK